ncbi:tyrosine-type recombinase/integrase [Weissella minor]|uniref:tyrosine-type recombinase/integrase n=1 Tax=Weissella minor TaxID=1620 RepID=UPI003AF1F1B8
MTTYTKEKRDPQIQWYETSTGKRWRVKFSINKFGKRRYIEKSGYRSFAEARSGKLDLLNDIELNLNMKGGKQTVSEYWKTYCDVQLKSGIWRDTTYETKKSFFKRHIQPYFGDYPIQDIQRPDVQKWATSLAVDKHLSKLTITTTLGILKAMLEDAVINDYLVKNPVVKIAITGKTPKDQSISKKDYETLVDYIFNSDKLSVPERAMAILALHGLRRGEIIGMKVKYITHDSITIAGQRNNQNVYVGLKTKSAYRDVPLLENTYSYLLELLNYDKQLLLSQNRILSNEDFIFLNDEGQPFVTQKLDTLFRRISNDVGFRVWPHKMRHAFSTFAFNIPGANPKDIMNILGHANIDMSMKYNMGTKEGSKQVIDAFSENIL